MFCVCYAGVVYKTGWRNRGQKTYAMASSTVSNSATDKMGAKVLFDQHVLPRHLSPGNGYVLTGL